jgi:hypothetical protein
MALNISIFLIILKETKLNEPAMQGRFFFFNAPAVEKIVKKIKAPQ